MSVCKFSLKWRILLLGLLILGSSHSLADTTRTGLQSVVETLSQTTDDPLLQKLRVRSALLEARKKIRTPSKSINAKNRFKARALQNRSNLSLSAKRHLRGIAPRIPEGWLYQENEFLFDSLQYVNNLNQQVYLITAPEGTQQISVDFAFIDFEETVDTVELHDSTGLCQSLSGFNENIESNACSGQTLAVVVKTNEENSGDLYAGFLIRGYSYTDGVARLKPTAVIAPETLTVAVGVPLLLDGSASFDPDAKPGETLTYLWNFGDNETADTASVQHTYLEPGIYKAKLTVTDVDQLSSEDEVTVEVTPAPPPVASLVINAEMPRIRQVVQANVSGSTGGATLLLDWGDGTDPVESTNFSRLLRHTYSTPGIYLVSLTVTNAEGIVTSAVKSLTVILNTSPVLDRLIPDRSLVGAQITVTGRGFLGTKNVTFNGKKARSFTVVDDRTLRATVPFSATTGKLGVTNQIGTTLSARNFTILRARPVITELTPTSGPAGTEVVIKGKNLGDSTAVEFVGGAAQSFKAVSTTELRAVVPGAARTGRITVTTRGGTATTARFTVTP